MTPNGYQPENRAYRDVLTYPDKSLGSRADGSPRRWSRPYDDSPDVLTQAGHPPRRIRELVRALSNPDGLHAGKESGDPIEGLQEVRAYRDIPAYCDGCAGSAVLRRKCASYDCPFWAYRTGRNPHNPRRGIQPAFGPRQVPDTEGNVGESYPIPLATFMALSGTGPRRMARKPADPSRGESCRNATH